MFGDCYIDVHAHVHVATGYCDWIRGVTFFLQPAVIVQLIGFFISFRLIFVMAHVLSPIYLFLYSGWELYAGWKMR